uniref:basic salivary proline-rich protein 1-like n=1 Tax=Urocitellus parryii TaxID=9999 RepID=UPI000E559294|nr:basic salivary proline-rich protein 1-like [Urocitellus parryii]
MSAGRAPGGDLRARPPWGGLSSADPRPPAGPLGERVRGPFPPAPGRRLTRRGVAELARRAPLLRPLVRVGPPRPRPAPRSPFRRRPAPPPSSSSRRRAQRGEGRPRPPGAGDWAWASGGKGLGRGPRSVRGERPPDTRGSAAARAERAGPGTGPRAARVPGRWRPGPPRSPPPRFAPSPSGPLPPSHDGPRAAPGGTPLGRARAAAPRLPPVRGARCTPRGGAAWVAAPLPRTHALLRERAERHPPAGL